MLIVIPNFVSFNIDSMTYILCLTQNLQEELSNLVSDIEQERPIYQSPTREKDDGEVSETDNKMQEIDALLDSIANELEEIERELQAVYDCHLEYDSAVREWLTWFAEAKNKLSICQTEEIAEQSIDGKDQVIQVGLVLLK